MPKIQKLLVANRGEIAIRVLRTARERGLKTVAIYSEADANALHRFEADEALCIGPAESQKSYLSIPQVLDAAKKSGADAVHPGYGFLSENAAFAREVQKAGLLFVGPDAHMIEAMGDKVKARERVQKEGVPVVPGTEGLTSVDEAVKAVEELQRKRKDFTFPLLIKAAGGGGGKGMRVVRHNHELRQNLERAQSESIKAFNNPMIFVERYIEEPRHIEVQILGDGKNFTHLFERECSLQRRHQKVVEEAPSPSISDELRRRIHDAGVCAARSVNYKTVGTVEFIVSPQNDFYFLEMNTRIQVEHPVTEWISGTDLIGLQMDLAEGQSLSSALASIAHGETATPRGHAIEVRLYAEDSEHGFLPQPGRISKLAYPQWAGIRVETAVKSGSEISSFYDPMIAKISCWGPNREIARKRLMAFLSATHIEGVVTNRVFLLDILRADFFERGLYHTHQLESPGWRPSLSKKLSREWMAMICLKDHLDRKIDLKTRSLSPWQEAEMN